MPAKDSKEKQKDGDKEDRPSTEQRDNRVVEAISAIEKTIGKKADSSREQSHTDDRVNTRLQIATLVFVILTTIGIFIQACILYGSDKTFQETAISAREANEINIRPYIKINFLPETFTFTPNVAIKFTIENIGKLPGYARVATGFTWVTRNHPRPDNTPQATLGVGARFLFPDSKGATFTLTTKLSPRQIADLQSAEDDGRRLYFLVRVQYGPESEESRYGTQVCNNYQLSDGGINTRLDEESLCTGEDLNYAK
jgi:hypothetical protein